MTIRPAHAALAKASRALRPLVVALALVIALGTGSAAAAGFDDLTGQTLGDTPWRTAAPFDGSVAYDATAFTITSDEETNAAAVLGCGAWGSKTGWVRFATAVKGRVRVSVESGYDVIYHLFTVPLAVAPGAATVGDLRDLDCQDARTTGGEDYVFGYAIPAGQTVYVQTAAKCAAGGPPYPCNPAQQAAAPAGPTAVRLRFTPDDTDADTVPDTLDGCPTVAGPVGGCPDRDGDGVADGADACPDIRGRGADGCRLPDEDGDGFRVDGASLSTRDCNDDDAAINPGRPEILGNDVDENCDTFAAFDRDGDLYVDAPAGPDCDPTRGTVNPGRREIPGNALDEDCVGGPAPYPRVLSRVAPLLGLYGDGVIRPLGLSVLDVVAGMRIEVSCRGRGCPFSVQVTRVARTAAKVKVAKALARATKLAVGARLTVRITRPGHVGRLVRYTIRSRRRKPSTTTGCLAAGSTTTILRPC